MRIGFLVDGFNLYHSLKDYQADKNSCVKWLDIHSLCNSYISEFGRDARINSIHYFSAHARHRIEIKNDPDVINRHKTYIRALKTTKVDIELGIFKKKNFKCNRCHKPLKRFEEKETDVAIAAKMFELFHNEKVDHITLVTGDTDLIPAIKTCKSLYNKDISVLFPYKRSNDAYKNHVTKAIKIKSDRYEKHQFVPSITEGSGKVIKKPKSW